MIKFNITSSSDIAAVGQYDYEFNLIYLGKKAEHLSIDDDNLKENHLILEIIEDFLVVHPQKEVEAFLINGKRATGIKKVFRNDKIKIGETEIEIIDFKTSLFLSRKDVLDKKMKNLIESQSPLLPIIESIMKQGSK